MLVNGIDKSNSFEVQGRVSRGGGFGFISFGFNYFGHTGYCNGVYSYKNTKKGKKLSRMFFARPTNPQTTSQQAWRSVFSNYAQEWQGLDIDTKIAWNRKAKKLKMTGYNLFQSTHLKS